MRKPDDENDETANLIAGEYRSAPRIQTTSSIQLLCRRRVLRVNANSNRLRARSQGPGSREATTLSKTEFITKLNGIIMHYNLCPGEGGSEHALAGKWAVIKRQTM